LLQVSRVKALGEPVVDLCQQLVGCLPLALLLPQATVSRVASRPGVADAAGYRAWRRRTPATLSMFGPFRCTKEPYRRVIWAIHEMIGRKEGVWEDPKHHTKECGRFLLPASRHGVARKRGALKPLRASSASC